MRSAGLTATMLAGLLSIAIVALVLSAGRFDQAGRSAAAAGTTAQRADETLQAVLDMETGLRAYLLTGDSGVLGPWRMGRATFSVEATELLARLRGHEARALANRVLHEGRAYAAGYAQPLIAKRSHGALDDPRTLAAVRAGKSRVDRLRDDIARLKALDRAVDTRSIDGAIMAARRDRAVGIVALVAALVVFGAFVVLMRRGALAPLRRLQRAAERLSAGDLDARVPGGAGSSEFDDVSHAFNAMAGQLAERGRALVDDLEAARVEVLQRLARATEYRDDDTHEHTERVGALAATLGAALGLDPASVAMLRLAAPLHDVGKIGVPDSILLKPGRLTPEERAQMQRHTTIGADMLSDSPSPVLQMAEQIALGHHERWDGGGYPQGLPADEVPLVARIVAVADVFDALTTARPYKDPWPVQDAVAEILAQAGRQFDPRVVRAFATLDHAALAEGAPLGVAVAGSALA
ncbi:MAG: domain S-box protein [Solirubrobacteraceae bacterium]|nr:domain S-box protein [Solirubrobacteraceae bacterium]